MKMTLLEMIANFKKRLNRPKIQEVIAKAKARAEEERQAQLKAQEQIAKVLIPDDDVILQWEQPESTNPYKKGDKVLHKDATWISIIDDNIWEPGVYGWEQI